MARRPVCGAAAAPRGAALTSSKSTRLSVCRICGEQQVGHVRATTVLPFLLDLSCVGFDFYFGGSQRINLTAGKKGWCVDLML